MVDHFIAIIEERLDEPELKSARDELLADGLTYYQGVLQKWEDTPELQFELIRTYTGAAKVAESLGSRAEALKAYQRALTMLGNLVRLCPDVPQYRLELAEVHHNIGHFYAESGQIDQALRDYEAGRAIREQLRRDRPDDPRVLSGLARSHGFLGDLFLVAGRLGEAEAAYLQSHGIRQKLALAAPHDAVLQFELSRSFTNLASMNRQVGRLEDAIEAWRQSIALVELLDAERSSMREFRSDLAWNCAQLGGMLLESDPPAAAQALATLERGREVYGRLIGIHSGVPEYRNGLGSCLTQIGRVQRVLGKPAEGLHSCLEARDIFDRLVKENTGVTLYLSGLARSSNEIAILQLESGEVDQAQRSSERRSPSSSSSSRTTRATWSTRAISGRSSPASPAPTCCSAAIAMLPIPCAGPLWQTGPPSPGRPKVALYPAPPGLRSCGPGPDRGHSRESGQGPEEGVGGLVSEDLREPVGELRQVGSSRRRSTARGSPTRV